MARRQGPRHAGEADKQAEPAGQKAPVRVPRRKRRKPTGTASAQRRQPPAKAPARDDLHEAGYQPPIMETGAIKMSRAPRPAERPPANPDVFSYTFTIWKST
jgi:hypothetical protein